ncbi:MAG TPA: four helix bundle protein [Cyclobacteriaceae bacterium]|nr:four helix bundle protein [Cyclobacteriaceae bacterium]
MFDFEKLDVYQLSRSVIADTFRLLGKRNAVDYTLRDQWKRASVSVILNLAEGTGRMSRADKKHFYVMSRSSLFECVAVLEIIHSCGMMSQVEKDEFYGKYEQISKMLLGMIRGQGG